MLNINLTQNVRIMLSYYIKLILGYVQHKNFHKDRISNRNLKGFFLLYMYSIMNTLNYYCFLYVLYFSGYV